MDAEKVKNYWVVESDEALKVAWQIFNAKSYSYALFFGHLAIEKILKAIYVDKTKQQPPFTHNLLKLAEVLDTQLDQRQRDAFIEITAFNIESRYSDEDGSFKKKCTKEFAKGWLNKIEEIHKWLKSML